MTDTTAHPGPYAPPAIGSYVMDCGPQTPRIGMVTAYEGGVLFLRPPGGGIEWTVKPESLWRPTEADLERIRALTTAPAPTRQP